VFLILQKVKSQPNGLALSQVFLEKLFFHSSILKAPWKVFLSAVGFFKSEIQQIFKSEIWQRFKFEIW
jgi:hypothetical protein